MGSASSAVEHGKHILIVGGGYGGVHLALKLLKRHSNFTLVDAKDCMHHNIATVRAVVEPGFAKKIVTYYEPTFGKHFRRGKVIKIDVKEKVVGFDDGSELTYDILIIATGSSGPMKESVGTGEEIIEKYSKIEKEVEKSERVVIVGGGAIGVEVATEIASYYRDKKKVTIIHGGPKLVANDASENFTEKLMTRLKHMGINVVLDDQVVNLSELADGVHGSYRVMTTKGVTIDADIILMYTGLKVNTSAFASGLSDHMEASGALKVNEFFQVEGCEDVFAFGDCCNANERRLATVAKLEADLVARNLDNELRKRSLEPWKSDNVRMFMGLSLGRDNGIYATKGGRILPEFIIVNMKCKDMTVGQHFKNMNQPIPK